MGGAESKATMDLINKKVTNICTKVAQECTLAVDQDQYIRNVNTGVTFFGGTKLSQTADIDFSCLQTSNAINRLQTELTNELTQSADTSGQALWGAFSKDKSNAEVILRNIIQNNITTENLQKQYQSLKQKQIAGLGNTGFTFGYQTEVAQSARLLSQSVMNILSQTGVLDKIASNVDNSSKTETKSPFSFINDIVGSVGGSATNVIIGVIAIILLVFVGFPMLSGRSGNNNTTESSYRYQPSSRSGRYQSKYDLY